MSRKVVFCVPTVTRPYAPFLEALEASVAPIVAAGWEEGSVFEVGNPYISAARAGMTRKALDAGADVIVYLDHDLSWRPGDLLNLIEAEGDVVAGTYRFKSEPVEYMGAIITDHTGRPRVRASDGALFADKVPAGFLKVTRTGLRRYMQAYPELLYGEPDRFAVDLFNHGAHKGVWWGEDYAFCRRWRDIGGDIMLVPDLDLAHHGADGTVFAGNFHEYLLRCPGGSESDNPVPPS